MCNEFGTREDDFTMFMNEAQVLYYRDMLFIEVENRGHCIM